jgi:hypothetical protein
MYWSHNKGLHPFDGHHQWIAHVAVNSEEVGVAASERLVAAIGGQGGIVTLQGRLDTDPAQKRFAGIQKVLARHADVSLLAQQTANWDRRPPSRSYRPGWPSTAIASRLSGPPTMTWRLTRWRRCRL